jgi:hypothetical protein
VDPDEVIAKLSFDRLGHGCEFILPHDFFEWANHLTFAEPTEVASFLARRTSALLSGNLLKILQFTDVLTQLNSFRLRGYEDVGCPSTWRDHALMAGLYAFKPSIEITVQAFAL